jgi:phosphoribosylformylglycinamidine synthase
VIRPRALVVAGPGTNRDRDLARAFDAAGAEPSVVLAAELLRDPDMLGSVQILAVAGGFSYGDSLGAGRVLALDLTVGIGQSLGAFVASGRPVIGICNGFQVLTRAGLLPGSLGHNSSGRFECRWVSLDVDPGSHCLWTAGLDHRLDCPIAHGEGRYVHPDPASLDAAGQIALRYASGNPNGSADAIAGVCNPEGNVIGLMPHPENAVSARQHPRRDGRHLGIHLFRNGVAAAMER